MSGEYRGSKLKVLNKIVCNRRGKISFLWKWHPVRIQSRWASTDNIIQYSALISPLH